VFYQGKGARVLEWISAKRNGGIVTAILAFESDPFIQPPHCGVVQQQSFNDHLERVDEGIQALDVPVREQNNLNLQLGQAITP
jgi:hypothetical protein